MNTHSFSVLLKALKIVSMMVLLGLISTSCEKPKPKPDPNPGQAPLYTVIFDLNGGTVNPVPQDKKVKQGQTVTKPTPDPTKPSLIFKGWYTSKTGDTKWDFVKEKIYANTTLYAQWAEIEAKLLTFEFSGSANPAMALASEDREAILGTIPKSPLMR